MPATVAATASDSYSSATSSPSATMPSGIVPGSLLLTSLMIDGGSDLTITPPSGWTAYTRANNGTGSFLCAIFYRIADGSESSSYTYTLSSSLICSAQTLRIAGHDDVWENATPTQNTGLSESMGYYGVTTSTANALAIAYVGVDSTSNIPTTPSGFTSESSGNGTSRGWRISSLVVSSPGFIGNSYTSSQGSSRHWATIMIAIKPALTAPTDIPGCQLWLDASDSGSITESGGVVSQWNDKSGNSRHYSQSTSSYRPTISTYNGKGVILFDGSNDYLAPASDITVNSISAFVVLKHSTAKDVIVIGRNSGNSQLRENDSGNGKYSLFENTNSIQHVSTGSDSTFTTAHITAWVKNGTSSITFYRDGASRGTSSSGISTVHIFGQIPSIGGAAYPQHHLDGWIAEVIVYNTALSDAQRQDVEDYLTLKWLTAYTGSGTPSTPAITASGSGTFTAPSGGTYTGSGATTLPALTASGSGTFTAPTYTGSGGATLAAITASGTGTFTAPVYSATGAVTLPALSASGVGTFSAPVYSATGAATLPAITASGTGTHTAPTYTGSGTAALPGVTVAGVGTFTAPVYTGSGGATLPAVTASGSGAFAGVIYSGAGAGTLPTITATGSGTFTAPTYTATGATTLPAVTASGVGSFVAPVYTGSGGATLPAIGASGSGAFASVIYSGAGGATLPAVTVAGVGAFTLPTVTGSGAAVLPAVSASGVGTFTAPVYTGSGGAVLPALSVAGVGDYSNITFTGAGGAVLPAMTASGAGIYAQSTIHGASSTVAGAGYTSTPASGRYTSRLRRTVYSATTTREDS